MDEHTVTFRFYEELNDFLPGSRKKIRFRVAVQGRAAVKDTIEALGIPHTEVDLILVNGISVAFSHPLENGDDVAVYPVFESIDISAAVRLRPAPLRKPRFILDGHLGTLTRNLRLLGIDALYRNDFEDAEILRLAERQKRIILTRDIGILKHGSATRGYWVRGTHPDDQTREVLRRFDLYSRVRAFTRCSRCNGTVAPVRKEDILPLLEPRTKKYYQDFFRCGGCGHIYWKGSHYEKLQEKIDAWMRTDGTGRQGAPARPGKEGPCSAENPSADSLRSSTGAIRTPKKAS